MDTVLASHKRQSYSNASGRGTQIAALHPIGPLTSCRIEYGGWHLKSASEPGTEVSGLSRPASGESRTISAASVLSYLREISNLDVSAKSRLLESSFVYVVESCWRILLVAPNLAYSNDSRPKIGKRP